MPRSRYDQRTKIKAALQRRELLTAVTALEHYRITRLAAVVERIRRLDGWPVETHTPTPGGLAQYRLPRGWTPSTPTPHR